MVTRDVQKDILLVSINLFVSIIVIFKKKTDYFDYMIISFAQTAQ